MEQGSLEKTQTPGPRPRRAPINLYGIRMTAYKHLYYGVGPVATPNWYGLTFVLSAPIRRALEIWAGSVMLDAPMGPNGGLPSAVPPPIGSSPAIQFLRSWPMTWDFGSGTLSYPVARRHMAGGIDWSRAGVAGHTRAGGIDWSYKD